MKANKHPNYQECSVRCSCGAEWKTRSTRKELVISLCSNCHPFYTGQQKFVDTAGRIDKFNSRFSSATAESLKEQMKARKKEARNSAKNVKITTARRPGKPMSKKELDALEAADRAAEEAGKTANPGAKISATDAKTES